VLPGSFQVLIFTEFVPTQAMLAHYLESRGFSVATLNGGMGAEEQGKVFDMFYQADASTRRSASGAGLGLAIARGIVVMHGGQITVRSEKGQGSTFSFTVPRHKLQKAA
jgi:signal transduction histidine kinase